jgi:hypothetical protein
VSSLSVQVVPLPSCQKTVSMGDVGLGVLVTSEESITIYLDSNIEASLLSLTVHNPFVVDCDG